MTRTDIAFPLDGGRASIAQFPAQLGGALSYRAEADMIIPVYALSRA